MYLNSPSKAELALGYGWLLVDTGGYRVSGADGSAGTFYARLLILPAHDVGFAAMVNSGAGDPVLHDAFRTLTGLPW